MAFLVSPGVRVTETDLTNIIPAVSTSIGGYAGVFKWGPTNTVTQVTDEADLIRQFGYPVTDASDQGGNSREDWYSAANFLGYTNNLQLVRVLPDGARNAASEPVSVEAGRVSFVVSGDPTVTGTITVSIPTGSDTNENVIVSYTAMDTQQGVANKLAVEIRGLAAYDSGDVPAPVLSDGNHVVTIPAPADLDNANALVISDEIQIITLFNPEQDTTATESTGVVIENEDDFLAKTSGEFIYGTAYAKYPGAIGNGIGVALLDSTFDDSDFNNRAIIGVATASTLFDTVPGTSTWATGQGFNNLADEVHVIVYTTDSTVTGTTNQILETYSYLSKAKNGRTADGAVNYYVDVVNSQSRWVYLRPETGASRVVEGNTVIGSTITSENGSSTFNAFVGVESFSGFRKYDLGGGHDGAEVDDGDYTEAYDQLSDVETVDISLIFTGSANEANTGNKVVKKHVIQIAETRKDCVAYTSPDYQSSVNNPTARKVTNYFSDFNSTSYAVFDSGWKRQYDRYNDEYFWIPLNADIAGLSARTDYTNEAWYSPAGLNRGFVRNVVKLSFNPNQADRDSLYTQRVNPVVTFRGQGTLLYGDKTALSRPSAFDRINVRRLFIVLEKAIATASKFQLFEFNDDLTRRTFVNAVEPFLQDILSRRGLTDFRVVCDESNNTGEVIDGNRFVADIYIKPTRSINFITLNFVAVRTGVSFSEVAGG